MTQPQHKATYYFVSLGCPKNLVDTERMLGILAQSGYVLVDDPAEADVIIINTCGFIESARAESLGMIREVARLRRTGPCRALVVVGCLVERDRERLCEQIPEIDALAGVFARERIAAICDSLLQGKRVTKPMVPPPPDKALDDTARLRITPRHMGYLKIAEGCNRRCTFCTIPAIRGPYVSKPIEQIRAEAEELASDGVRELCVIAQDTTSYGIDLYGRPRLADVLGELNTVEDLHWIRLMYAYPQHFSDALIEVLGAGGKVVPYIDLPIQHISDPVLRRMGRRVTRRETETLIDTLRTRIPGLVLRTTLIAGFPGETEAQFEELLTFLQQTRFERAGCFVYSDEAETPAARLPDPLPEPVRRERYDRLMTCQQEIAFEWNRQQVGRAVEVVVDARADADAWAGRSYADAPDIDGLVTIDAEDLCAGQFVNVTVTAADGYDLQAEPTRPGTPTRWCGTSQTR